MRLCSSCRAPNTCFSVSLIVLLGFSVCSHFLSISISIVLFFFFFQAEDGIRDLYVTGVQTCALPIFTFAVGIFTVFFDVAYQSYLPALVDRDSLVEGNSKLQTTASLAGTAGPGMAGLLISALTAPYAIVLDAASFVVSTAFMIPIRSKETLPERAAGAPRPKLLPELREGLAYVLRQGYLRWIATCTGTSNYFGQMIFAVSVLYMQRTLHMSAFLVGVVFAGFGIGATLDAIGTTRFQRAVGVGRAIWMPAVLFSLSGFAFPLAPQDFPVPFLMAGTLAFGVASTVY